MSSHTPGPWTTKGRAYKDSNFGGYGCRIVGAREGDTAPSVAKAYGGTKDEREVAEANAAYIVKAVNAHEALVGALKTALHELRAIQARDGAPQHIDWDRGRPLQTDSCTHEWWSTVVDKCDEALKLANP